jgi:hypothetical protein
MPARQCRPDQGVRRETGGVQQACRVGLSPDEFKEEDLLDPEELPPGIEANISELKRAFGMGKTT